MANATETQAGGLDPDLSQNGYGHLSCQVPSQPNHQHVPLLVALAPFMSVVVASFWWWWWWWWWLALSCGPFCLPPSPLGPLWLLLLLLLCSALRCSARAARCGAVLLLRCCCCGAAAAVLLRCCCGAVRCGAVRCGHHWKPATCTSTAAYHTDGVLSVLLHSQELDSFQDVP